MVVARAKLLREFDAIGVLGLSLGPPVVEVTIHEDYVDLGEELVGDVLPAQTRVLAGLFETASGVEDLHGEFLRRTVCSYVMAWITSYPIDRSS